MPRRVLTIDAAVDSVTQAGLAYREPNLYSRILPPSGQLTRLQGLNAVRGRVQPVVAQPSFDYLLGVAHGSSTAFFGGDGNPVFQVGGYGAEEVLGRGVHFTACSTARTLGPDTVRNGAKFFIGYVQDILFPVDLGPYIFDADAQIDHALLAGLTAGEAQASGIARFDHYIQSFSRSGAASYYIQSLVYNRSVLRGPLDDVAYGSQQARL